MVPQPRVKKSLWNTPVREVVKDWNVEPPDLGFLIKPVLAGFGIFLIIFFGYKLFMLFSEMIVPVVTTNGNTTTTTGIISLIGTTNSTTLVFLLLLPIWIFILWRPIRRFMRDI